MKLAAKAIPLGGKISFSLGEGGTDIFRRNRWRESLGDGGRGVGGEGGPQSLGKEAG